MNRKHSTANRCEGRRADRVHGAPGVGVVSVREREPPRRDLAAALGRLVRPQRLLQPAGPLLRLQRPGQAERDVPPDPGRRRPAQAGLRRVGPGRLLQDRRRERSGAVRLADRGRRPWLRPNGHPADSAIYSGSQGYGFYFVYGGDCEQPSDSPERASPATSPASRARSPTEPPTGAEPGAHDRAERAAQRAPSDEPSEPPASLDRAQQRAERDPDRDRRSGDRHPVHHPASDQHHRRCRPDQRRRRPARSHSSASSASRP